MINLDQFIADHVINRQKSMFADDIKANKSILQAEIENKSVCVIGGAGSIGSSFIKAILPFKPSKLVVIDLNENGLADWAKGNVADPWLIAAAAAKDYKLITFEQSAGSLNVKNKSGRVKIPDVARHFGVEVHNLYYMMRQLGIKI